MSAAWCYTCWLLLPLAFGRRLPADILPLDHPRLASRDSEKPDQLHLALAGVGTIAVQWVTQPLEDGRLAELLALSHGSGTHCSKLKQLPLRSMVEFGRNASALNAEAVGDFTCYEADEYRSGALHTALMGAASPLEPGAEYWYRVGDPDAAMSEIFSFIAPPPPGTVPYRLGVIGDLGQTDNSIDTLDHVQAQQPASILNVGDLSYADGYQPRWDTFGRLIEPSAARVPWQVIEGNHEEEVVGGVDGFLAYQLRYYVPSSYSESGSALFYSYEVAALHIIMLGCYAEFGPASKQVAWLRRDLQRVDRSRTPFVIVGMHAPWYNSNLAHDGEMDDMQAAMEELLFEHGVDIVYAGHVHAYERMHRVYKGKEHPCGPVYINIGDGGNREGLSRDYSHPQPRWSAVRDASYGAGMLDVLNATHAAWSWHRNQDGAFEVGDQLVVARDVGCMAARGGTASAAAAADGAAAGPLPAAPDLLHDAAERPAADSK